MNEELKLLFQNFKVNNKLVPVHHLKYKGKLKTFITWILLEEIPILSANDETLYSICSVDIDIYSDSNYLDIIKEIKKIMKDSGWLWTGDSAEMYEDETGLYHKTISFEKERII